MDASWESPLTAPPLARQCAIAALKRAGGRQAAVQAGCRRGTASERAPKPLCVFWVPHKYADESAAPCGQAKVFRAHVEGEEVKCFIRDAQVDGRRRARGRPTPRSRA
jgi:ribosomal protein L25 (general stress protein Ctc)